MKSFLVLRDFFRANAWRYLLGIFWLIVVNTINLQVPRLLGEVTDLISTRQIGSAELLRYAGYILGIAAVMAFGRFSWRIYIMGSARRLEYFVRSKLFSHLESLSTNFYNENKTGDLMAHATNDINAVRMAMGPGILMLSDSIYITTITVYTMATNIDWRLTLLALIPLPFLAFIAMFFGKKIHTRFKDVQKAFSSMTDRVQENLSGIRVIKSFVQEEAEIARFDEAAGNYVAKNMKMIKLWGLFMPVIQLIAGISYIIVLAYGGILVINARITLGEFVAFNSYLGMLIWPMMAVGRVINVLQRGTASMDRLNTLFTQKSEVNDPQGEEFTVQGQVEFRDLSFSYPDGTQSLKNISIKLDKGKTLAIIGRTGSGKTTLVNLLLRMYNAPPGQLLVDGIYISKYTISLSSRRS